LKQLLFYLFIISLFIACKQSPKTTALNVKDHFDIPAFFAKEAKRLNDAGPQKVQKQIIQNKTREEKILTIEDWTQELALFSQNKIHGPTLYDLYKVDSSFYPQGGLKTLKYKALDKTLPTLSLEVHYDEKTIVEQLLIERKVVNRVFDTQHKLIYQPLKGYQFNKAEKVILFKKNQFEIKVQLMNE